MPWPVSEKYVLDCEGALKTILPNSYRLAMMNENGGEISGGNDIWTLHPIWDKTDKRRLKRTSNDVVRETKAMCKWEGWPDSAICIGANGSGDALLFVSKNGMCEPTVFCWNHETGLITAISDEFTKLKKA